MSFQTLNKNNNSEEDDSDLIINADDFWVTNDLNSKKSEQIKNNKEISTTKDINNNNNKGKLYLISDSTQNIVEKEKNENLKNNLLNANKENKINNENKDNINTYNEEKTIFSKIAEDLFVDNMDNLKEKNDIYKIFNSSKIKDDNYNKLTVENYLFTCADKENSKNWKIITNFIERKEKEQIFKKLRISPEKININSNFDTFKRLSIDHKKIRGFKKFKKTRTPSQFLDDQKILEEKHKKYIHNLIKLHNDEINLQMRDRPIITKNSERLANLNKNKNKSVHLKLYEEFSNKKNNIKNNLLLNEINSKSNSIKKIDKNTILQNAKRLYKEYEIRKNNINENEINQLNNIKKLSTISSVNKQSNNIISNKFINIYKKELKSIFNKNISDNFDINFMDYLLFIYKLGLTEKNYNKIVNENTDIKNLMLNNFENRNSNKSNRKKSPLIKDKISLKIDKKNTYTKSKSMENKKNEINNKIFKIIKNSWKIITKNKIFNKEILTSSYMLLIFFLSLCGIYKGEINNIFIKKNLPFLLKNDSNNNIISVNVNIAKQIYKYFYIFRNCFINNINKRYKTIKIQKIKNINNNLIKNSKSSNNSKKKLFNSNSKKNYVSIEKINIGKIKNKNKTINNDTKIEKQIYKKNNIKKYKINRIRFPTERNKTKEDKLEEKLDMILKNKIKKIKNIGETKKKNNNKIYETDIKKNKDGIIKNAKILNYKDMENNVIFQKKNEQRNINGIDINIKNNLNDNEISENFDDYKTYRENNVSDSNQFSSKINTSKNSNEIINLNLNNNKKKKNKFTFKIKIKDKMIKLIINKNDNFEVKINEFCKENNLDEEDRHQIIEAVQSKLKEYN